MTKAELIKKVSAAANCYEITVSHVLDGLRGVLETELKNGESVVLPGIGKFAVRATAARTGRNPRTGEAIAIPAGRRVAFTASKGLKNIIAG